MFVSRSNSGHTRTPISLRCNSESPSCWVRGPQYLTLSKDCNIANNIIYLTTTLLVLRVVVGSWKKTLVLSIQIRVPRQSVSTPTTSHYVDGTSIYNLFHYAQLPRTLPPVKSVLVVFVKLCHFNEAGETSTRYLFM